MKILDPEGKVKRCVRCGHALIDVLLTAERIKIECGTAISTEGLDWFYNWSQKQHFVAGPLAMEEGDHAATEFPTWYCATCMTVWVAVRGLLLQASLAPTVPAGIVNAGDKLVQRFL